MRVALCGHAPGRDAAGMVSASPQLRARGGGPVEAAFAWTLHASAPGRRERLLGPPESHMRPAVAQELLELPILKVVTGARDD